MREPKRGAPLQGCGALARDVRAPERVGAGLAQRLSDRGWRTIAFDFRGHGDSGPGAAKGATWTYDDLVVHDLPAVVEGARARARGRKVIVVGHSPGAVTGRRGAGDGR